MVKVVILSKEAEITQLEQRLNDAIQFSKDAQAMAESFKRDFTDDEANIVRRHKANHVVSAGEDAEDSDCAPGEFANNLKLRNFADALDDYAWMKEGRNNNLENFDKLI